MADILKAGRSLELRPLNLRDAKALCALVEANRERLRRWLPWPDANRGVSGDCSTTPRCLSSFSVAWFKP